MIDLGLDGRKILVVGGSSGIGHAVVELARAQGAQVAVASSGLPTDRAAGHYRLDIRDGDATETVVDDIESEMGPLDGVVVSAGVSAPGESASLPTEKWQFVVDVNLTGSFHVLRSVGSRMVVRGRGSLVAVGSVNSFGGHVHRASYSASKAAITGLVRTLAIEWGCAGVRVNAVAPGPVDTPLLRSVLSDRDIARTFLSRTPVGRLSLPSEQAWPALFLLSDAASYINGAIVPVDGGITSGFFNNFDVE